MFSRVAIADRGAAAVRLIHTVRELDGTGSPGGRPVRTVALHHPADRHARFVREADLTHELGAGASGTGEAGAVAGPLDLGAVERALAATAADAVWPGWGLAALDAGLAELCRRLSVTFVGAAPDVIRLLADPAELARLGEKAGLATEPSPAVPGALAAAGPAVRELELPLLADDAGTVWPLGLRDASLRRQGMRVLDETATGPAPEVTAALDEAARQLVAATGLRGAATVRVAHRPADGAVWLRGVVPALTAAHLVGELVTGLDLVALQLRIAAGERLPGAAPEPAGHAVAAAVFATGTADGAGSGRVELLRLPSGPGVRVDAGVGEGDRVPLPATSTIPVAAPGEGEAALVATVAAHGPTREAALTRLRRALSDTTVVIEGATTTKSFLLDLIDRPEVRAGTAAAGWVDAACAGGELLRPRHVGVALVAAAIDAYQDDEAQDRRHFLATAAGGRPQAGPEVGRAIDLEACDARFRVRVAQVAPRRFRVRIPDPSGAGWTADVLVDRSDRHTGRLRIGDRTYRLVTARHGERHTVEVDGAVHRVARSAADVVRAPAPALVVSVAAAEGDVVEAGAPVAVLESMKMETVLAAPFRGRVRDVLVSANDQVEPSTPLLRLEPLPAAGEGPGSLPEAITGSPAVLDLPAPEAGAAAGGACLDDLRHLLLGFDLALDEGRRCVREHASGAGATAGADPVPAELDVLTAFADLCELTRNRPAGTEAADDVRVHSPQEYFHSYLRSLDADREQLPGTFRDRLLRALGHYGIDTLARTEALEQAVYRMFRGHQRMRSHVSLVTALLERWATGERPAAGQAERVREVLDRLAAAAQVRFPGVGDLARSIRFRWFEQPVVEAARERSYAQVREQLSYLWEHRDAPDHAERIERLVASPEPLARFLAERLAEGVPAHEPMLEVLARRHYRDHGLADVRPGTADGRPALTGRYHLDGRVVRLVSALTSMGDIDGGPVSAWIGGQLGAEPGADAVVDLYLSWPQAPAAAEECVAELVRVLGAAPWAGAVRRVVAAVSSSTGGPVRQFTLRPGDGGGLVEDTLIRDLHPMVARRLGLWRLREFEVSRLEAPHDVLLYRCVAPGNPSDQRLVALAQVRELTVVRDESGRVASLPQVERTLESCLAAVRRARAEIGSRARLDANHVFLHIWPPVEAPLAELTALKRTIAPLTGGAGLTETIIQGRVPARELALLQGIPAGDGAGAAGGADRAGGGLVPVAFRFGRQPGAGVVATIGPPSTERLQPLDDYTQKVLRSRSRGTPYPYELLPQLAREGGDWVEHDLDDSGRLVPVERAPGRNRAGIVAAVVSTPTPRYPEGMRRVVLIGDPTKALGAVAEPECHRICAALDLAEELGLPLEWFALSAGARISMDSGTENMDWVAKALRRIIEFTQAGHEINVVVTGINVGAQPYWNSEATMLLHTKGILVMTPDSAMVLTGKQSLDYSGGVSAEDNHGIGGYDRVMGPNGQAQYWAPDLAGAIDVLFAHYDHAYRAPGERWPRPAPTADPRDRDVRDHPHVLAGSDFTTVGDVFSAEANPERKKPFDIRTVMRAVADADHPTLERWAAMADADTSVVLDAHLGGYPVCMLGIESHPVARRGFPPTDGPASWTAGTLFPLSSKKTARAINAASGNRPLVVLANLSGFDGSPESMRRWQLEYGAEIGRAVVNFDGPVVFCVISRYHGGAFVVFSKALHDNMQVLAVEGSYSSVIGGAPAAAVVFAGEVNSRTAADPRVKELEGQVGAASGVERARLAARLSELRAAVRSEKLGQVAAEFDQVHDIDRAVAVGSVDTVISGRELRPRLIEALEDGLARYRPRG